MIRRLGAQLRQLVAILRDRRSFEREIDAELEFHLQARADQLQSTTVDRAEALRQARIELGMLELHCDQIRRSRGLHWPDWISADLRLAWRSLRATPVYTLTAVVVLAAPLAIGLLLHGLYAAYSDHSPPFDRVERWVHLYGDNMDDRQRPRFSAAQARLLVEHPPSGVDGLYSARLLTLPLATERVLRGIGVAVSSNYFDLTGIPAARGRVYSANESDRRGVVLSQSGWTRFFQRREDVLGQPLSIAGQPFTVIGVAGRDFRGSNEIGAHYWMLSADHQALWPEDQAIMSTTEVGGFLASVGSTAALTQALGQRAEALNRLHPDQPRLSAIGVESARGFLRESDRRELRLALVPIAALVLLMLLIAAANLTNLVLARFSARRHDMALRAALGATRGRLFAQLLTECALLGTAAATFAWIATLVLLRPLHELIFSFMAELGFDPIQVHGGAASLPLALTMALLATVAFGALPSWLATRIWSRRAQAEPQAGLKGVPRSRLRGALMVVQLAASVFLVVVAAMIGGVASQTQSTPLGYDPNLLVSVDSGTNPQALRQALLRSPHVREIAATSTPPLMGEPRRREVLANQSSHGLQLRHVDLHWFATLGMAPLRGRLFNAADTDSQSTVVLSRSAAERLWPGVDPLGKTLELTAANESVLPRRLTVVGVVADIATGFLIRGAEQPMLYLPARLGDAELQTLLLSLSDASPSVLAELYAVAVAVDPLGDSRPQRLSEALRAQQLPLRIASYVGASLGWIALAISCLGLYGLVSFAVAQRRREIGVRVALGARSINVIVEVMRAAVRHIALGIAIGLPAAYALTVLISHFTDLLQLVDLQAFVLAPALLGLIAAVAAWLPARQSARIPPSEALRE